MKFKLQKDTLIIVLVCGVFIFGWAPFCRYMGWSTPREKAPAAAPAQPEAPEAPASPEAPPPAAPIAPPAAAPAPASPVEPAAPAELPKFERLELENAEIRLQLDPNVPKTDAIHLKQYLRHDRETPVKLLQLYDKDRPMLPGALELFFSDSQARTVAIETQTTENSLTVNRRTVIPGIGEITIEQSWQLAGGYVTDYRVTLRNPGRDPVTLPSFVISAGELGKWSNYSKDRMRSDPVRLDYCTTAGEVVDLPGDHKKDSKFFQGGVRDLLWTSISNKYVICLLQSDTPFALWQGRIRAGDKNYIASTGARYERLSLPAGGETVLTFRYYSGPKIVSRLEAFSPLANRTMHLSWGPLDYLARFMLWALIQLKEFCGSYGWSIILITVIVRLIFWPVTARANASMKKMSAVQPKIKELREKYKDNPQLLNSKTMELYRSEKINPLGGCLPMLMQLPILFALYATLDGAVELRQVPFLWAKDLAAADTIFTLFGVLPVNPLVIVWSVLMFIQQRLTPSTMEPMQQKIMTFMPLFMLIVVYNLPSGLTLYFTVGQIFSLLQMLLQQKLNLKGNTAAASGAKPGAAPKP